MTTALKIGSSVITSVGSKTNTCVKAINTRALGNDKYKVTFSLWKSQTSMDGNEDPCVAIFKDNALLKQSVTVDIAPSIEPSRTTVLQALKTYLEDTEKEFGFTNVTEITE